MDELEQLIEIIAEACEISTDEVDVKKRLIDLPGWDSLASVTLTTIIDEKYSKIMYSDDYDKAVDIYSLLSIIKGK